MKTFSIVNEFRDVLTASDVSSPYDAIDDVLARIPANATAATLRLIIRDCLVAIAPSMPSTVNRTTPASATGAPKKAAGLTELRLLRERIAVGDGAWKFIGDSTPDEIDIAAEWRETLAASNAVAAKRLRRIAEVARQCGADVIRDVPAADLEEFER